MKKRASYLHRTATTVYPCFLPNLGDSTGAGRTRLTRGGKSRKIRQLASFITEKCNSAVRLVE